MDFFISVLLVLFGQKQISNNPVKMHDYYLFILMRQSAIKLNSVTSERLTLCKTFGLEVSLIVFSLQASIVLHS